MSTFLGKGLCLLVLRSLGTKTATGIVGGYTGKQIEVGLEKLHVPYEFVRIKVSRE